MRALWAAYAFIVGACIGSFLNVCVSRWPAGLSVVRPRSRCPVCERQITAFENIPLLSWIYLRGKCRGCGTRISVQYPIVELVVGLIWLGAFLYYDLTFTALRLAVLATILLGVAITDARHYVIPDGFTVSGFLWGIATAVVALFTGDREPFASLPSAILGACTGAGAIIIVGWLGEVAVTALSRRWPERFPSKEVMGFGDATLMAMIGAAVGPGRALLTIFVGSLLAAVVFVFIILPVMFIRARRAGTEPERPLVPFGVFLAPAAFIALLWGETLIATYRNATGL